MDRMPVPASAISEALLGTNPRQLMRVSQAKNMDNMPLLLKQGRSDLQEIPRFGDLVMLLTMVASAAAALAIGDTYGQFGLALGASAGLGQ